MAAAKNSKKVEDLRTKTDDQLSADLGDLKREQFNLRFQAATNQLDLADQFDQLTQPTLVITGDSDNFIPTEESIQLAGELPNAELAVLPDCGHLPQQECETLFLQTVEDWLAGLPGK